MMGTTRKPPSSADTFPYKNRAKPVGFYPLPWMQPSSNVVFDAPRSLINVRDNLLYIHIPFCNQRCSFCLFYLYPNKEAAHALYFRQLLTHLRMISADPFVRRLQFSALFVGGGTPSLLSSEEIQQLMRLISSEFDLSDDFETTFEWHPQERSGEKLAAAVEAGVNRLSFGVQTFDPETSLQLGLPHSRDDSLAVISAAKALGVPKVNVDILSFVHQDGFSTTLSDIDVAVAAGATAITVNPLEVIPHTPYARMVKTGRRGTAGDGDARANLVRATNEALRTHGFVNQRFYNYTVPGLEHSFNRLSALPASNLVSVGSGSYGYINGIPYFHHSDINKYNATIHENRLPIARIGDYSYDEVRRAFLVASLLELQIDRDVYFAAFNAFPEREYGLQIESLVSKGLLRDCGQILRLTELGLSWGDNVCLDLYSNLQRSIFMERFNEDRLAHHYAPSANIY